MKNVLRLLLSLLLLVATLGPALFATATSPAQARHVHPAHRLGPIGSALSFDDEFNGSTLDPAKWNVAGDPGYPDPNLVWGAQRYTPSAVSVHDGVLTLTTSARPPDGTDPAGYPSGAVTTEGKWTMRYGRLDVRARLTHGRGLWPALWLLPVGQLNWVSDYEIDLMELLGRDPHTVYFTLHWAHATHQRQCHLTGPDFSASFHTFTLLWQPHYAAWAVDGIVRCTITGAAVSNEGMYLIINDAVGGTWGGYPDASTPLPQSMLVDYVRARA